ncbi:MAG: energy transducer TonB [Saprospiraceae bacterium]|nr:energy transducer TonB [Saprospiraceae bacterium]
MKCQNRLPILFLTLVINSCADQQTIPSTEPSEHKTVETATQPQTTTDSLPENISLKASHIPLSKVCYLPSKITEITPIDKPKSVLAIQHAPLIEGDTKKQVQYFIFSSESDTTINGKEGTILKIPKLIFETETGSILKGNVKLELTEFLRTSDMVLANLTTESDEKPLETGGMLYINATDGLGNTIKIRSDRGIHIELPTPPNPKKMSLFYGQPDINRRVNWQLAQAPVNDSVSTNYLTIIEQSPEFPNGQAALFQYIQQKIVYPKIARENKVEGIVYVGFIVSSSGMITDAKVKRGIGYGCNEVALNIVKSMPRWRPGRSQGRAVSTAYTLPIRFQLTDKNIQTVDRVIAENFVSEDFVKDSATTNRFIEIEDKFDYIMRTQRLGWINCDRFLNFANTSRANFVVWTDKQDTEVRLVFKNFRSILSSWSQSDNKAYFKNIPIGEPVFFVATSPEGGKLNVAVVETTISKNENFTLHLKTVEKDEFLKELYRLDLK